MQQPSSRLIHLLLAKSVLEALLITVVAVAFYFATTNPYVRGWLDRADSKSVSGWVVDESNSPARVEVQLFIDGRFIGDKSAADFRPDVHTANRANDDWHGFAFDIPTLQAGEHEARAYAVHAAHSGTRQTLQLIGKPLRFYVPNTNDR
jgi:hypothetical protein